MYRPQLLSLTLLASAIFAVSLPASAQAPLTNAALKGTYNVRYLGVIGYPNDYPISFSGTMTFDGNGNVTSSGSGVYFNGSASVPVALTSPGTYSVLSSGEVAIANPFSTANGSATLYGGVGFDGVVVASSTEDAYLDLFVAIPQGSGLSNATMKGTYHVAGLEFAGGSISSMRSVSFNTAADGNGNLGNLALAGSSSALSDNSATQSISGATYTMTSNGTGTMVLPSPTGIIAANQLIAGTKTLYVSPDGSFFVSGSPTGWDMQLGVQAIASGGATIFSGLYYSAAVENITGTGGFVDAWYGASNELPTLNPPTELVHERINDSEFGYPAYDETSSDSFAPGNDGTSSAADYYFAVGASGNFAIQTVGEGDYYLQVWIKAPSFSGSGVFLNPTAVVNAASNAPFTAQISPGEAISLYGTGFMSGQPQSGSLPFPTNLGGVQVMINGTAAPLYYASATQINAVVPYSNPSDGSLASVQVISNSGSSNTVQTYTGLTSPGVFTVPPGGVGYAAILHADYSLVNASSPAKVGETVQLFLTGLGATTPAIAAGTAAPSSSATVFPVEIYIDDFSGNYTTANITYQGLAPDLGGLYQVNFTIPSGLTLNSSGITQFYVEVSMLDQADADNMQALIPISQ